MKQQLLARLSRVRRSTLVMLLAGPVLAFYLSQFILGGWPWQYGLSLVLANSLCYGAIYYLLCALTGRVALSFVLIQVIAGIWAAANHFVSVFRGTPVLPWDFSALGTAAAVAGSYSFVPTWQMLVVVLVLAAEMVLLRHRLFSRRRHGAPWLHRAAVACVGVLCVLAARPGVLSKLEVKTDVWDPAKAYRETGALASFICNTAFMQVEKPEEYSAEAVEQLLASQPELPVAGDPPERPNVIAIMNESWADFEEWGNLSLSESVTDYIRGLDNTIFGHAYTSVFGAGTSASEFEFLTGNSMAFLPSGSIPYQQYILGPSDSLASLLSEQGYRTLAVHPGERTSWQRNQAYPRLGFDDFKCEEDLDVPVTEEHGYISDDTSFRQIIWEFEHKSPEERLFLFNVTIQNHGAYTVADYPATVQLTDQPGKYPMAEQYLTLANKSDEAFRLLVDYFSAQTEPTIILMFGDHQPSVEQEFLDMAYGLGPDGMTMEQYMGKFRVPFVIWANYPLPQDELNDTSLNFLSQYLLQYAGLPAAPYTRYLYQLQTQLPAITFVGYTDTDGNAYSHLETNDYTNLIRQYQMVQYNNLFGSSERQSELFALSAS